MELDEAGPGSNDLSVSQSSNSSVTAAASEAAASDLIAEPRAASQDETIGHNDLRHRSAGEVMFDISSAGSWVGTFERAERTHYLELASEVSRAVSERMADLYTLLKDAVELIREKFDLYYTQIYLLDSAGHTLILRAGTGEVGKQLINRKHQLLVGTSSLNGRAASEKKAVIVSDTAQSADFLPNILLPNTRSEMAIPLLARGQVVGVLDMQSDEPNTLTEVYLPAFETLAGQLAITIQNAVLFAEVEQARSEVGAQVHRLTERNWQDFLDAIERGEKLGFVFDQLSVTSLEGESLAAEPDDVLNIPIEVTGTKIGAIQLKNEPGRTWTASETELIQVIAAQLSQHIENRRVVALAERYREQAEQMVSRLTLEGWKTRQARGNVAPGYVYDLNKVEELSGELNDNSADALKQPLMVRNESIGELTVDSVAHSDEAAEIVAAVAQQLSEHIESLRLFEQTQLALHDSREAEEALSANEARLSEALDIAKLAHWEYDVERDRFLFNDQFYSIFHTTVEEMGGYELSSAEYAQRLVYPEDLPVVGAAIEKALASTDKHYSTQLEHRVAYADGGMGYISVEIHIDRDDQGKIIRYYGANQDITERKLAEQTVRDSEAKLSEALEIAKLANWEYDVERDRFLFNDQFYSIFHTTAEAMGGYELSSAEYAQRLVYPEDLPVVGAAIEKALASTDKHYNTQLEHRVAYADGGMGYISVDIHIDRDDQGKIIRYYGANQDITERKLAEQAVAKRAAELQTVAEVSTTTAKTLEPDRLLQAVVDITKERFGIYHAHIYLADESWNTLLLAAGAGEIGRQMVATGHSIRMDVEKSLVARAARERQAVIVNDVRDDPAFLPNPLLPETRSEMAIPLIVGDTVLGVFDVQSDITNHFTDEDAYIYTTLASQVAVALQNARLYTEQAATVTQLRELDRLKTSFLANMSHELRTPLNSILGFSDVIIEGLDGPVTEQMDNDLRLIGKNGQHLLHLINDVLDMAKIDAGRMNLQPEKFKLNGLFEEAINITSSLADAKSLSVVIREDSDLGVEVYADRTRIQQVMINLINNAIKFTEQGRISLSARQAEDNVLIEVHDTGIGIPSEQLQTIFQEFTQVDLSPTRKTGGTGLGLPISRRLVELHGGRLWAESTGVSGEGSTFWIELPLIAKIAELAETKEK